MVTKRDLLKKKDFKVVKKRKNMQKRKESRNNKEEKMKPLETVIFIQHTMHSRLFKRMREKLSDIKKVGRIKVKMVERCVDKLTDLLHKSKQDVAEKTAGLVH